MASFDLFTYPCRYQIILLWNSGNTGLANDPQESLLKPAYEHWLI